MNRFKNSALFLLAVILTCACSSMPNRPWSDAIPEKAPFVIIPSEDASLNTVLESTYTPFLDDITSSAIQLLSRIDSTADGSIPLRAIMLYTGTNDRLETVWMAEAPAGLLEKLRENFYERFSQNEYFFHDVRIHKLDMQDRTLFATQLHDNLLMSESSLGIEDAIRAYLGKTERVDLSGLSLEPGHILMNTPSLDQWVRQLTSVTYRPKVKNALGGTKPALLSVSQEGEQQERETRLSGNIKRGEGISSDLVAAFSSQKSPITLDRYISSNAAAFGLFRLAPELAPPTSLPDTTRLDSLFMNRGERYTGIAQTLDPEFSLVTYAQSGFLSTGEHLFIRKVGSTAELRKHLAELAANDYIQRRNGTYFIQSTALATLIGSPMCTFKDYYLDVTGEGVVISKRKGLVEMVSSDRSRRRTMYYEQNFRNIKKDLPQEISGLFVTGNDFYSFIEPFLAPQNYVNAITTKFDLLAASATLDESGENIAFNLTTYQTEDRSAPYREKWLFPTGSDLSGKPVLADIGGSEQDEVIFATKAGEVYALAADGTVVMQANTGTDEPIGSPVVYDWYATNQNVILVAAGNKVYGWNDNGQPLPKFPFQLRENITSPLVVSDIDQNGLPDAIVATANRNLHALNGRGENIDGWPVTTNAEIRTSPTIENYLGGISVLAFSENAVHAWASDGSQRSGYPKFINASLNGSPMVYENNIFGNAADGYLYSIGPGKFFADSLNVFDTSADSSGIEAVYTSGSALTGTPSIQELTVNTEERVYREEMILTMSANGSVFLLNTKGQLRFTQNMGQPAAGTFSPFVTDINSNNRDDIVALANFGRLYVWEVYDGERIYAVPTSGMQFPTVSDIDGDGYRELMAQTREGLRCWTIFGESEQQASN